LVALAEKPNEWLNADDLAGAAFGPEAGWRAVATALSPLTKRMKRYGRTVWPFDLREDSRTGRYSYRMSDRTAGIIRELDTRVSAIIDDVSRN
jgi:hypothetical protein